MKYSLNYIWWTLVLKKVNLLILYFNHQRKKYLNADNVDAWLKAKNSLDKYKDISVYIIKRKNQLL